MASTQKFGPRTIRGNDGDRRDPGCHELAGQNMALYMAKKELWAAQQNEADTSLLYRESEDALVLTFIEHMPHIHILNAIEKSLLEEVESVFITSDEDEAYDKYEAILADIAEWQHQRAVRKAEIHYARNEVKALEAEHLTSSEQLKIAEDHLECIQLTHNEFMLEFGNIPREYRDLVSLSHTELGTCYTIGREDIDGSTMTIRPDGSKTGASSFYEQLLLMQQRDDSAIAAD